MSQAALLRFVATLLDGLQLRWMLVGSHAASYYGEPRSTHDVDLVVDLPESMILDLLAAVPTEHYYLSEFALREGRMANLIDLRTGDKVDLFLEGSGARNAAALVRRTTGLVMGLEIPIASAEDTILSKLRWNEAVGGSERQVRDIIGIAKVQQDSLDWSRLERQIDSEGFRDIWREQIEPELRRRSDETD